jgi:hypothetical protein
MLTFQPSYDPEAGEWLHTIKPDGTIQGKKAGERRDLTIKVARA